MSFPIEGWKNKNGTSERTCKCGSWENHWKNFSKRDWPYYCSKEGCINRATLGAHVINSKVNGEYIVPLCYSCNQLEDEFALEGGTVLVPANKSETCEKN